VDLAKSGYIPLSPDFRATVSSAVDAIGPQSSNSE